MFGFCVFFGGFKGQVRWPEEPPHLAQNPPYLFFVLFGFVLFFPLLLVFVFGGFKGQVRWPEGPPHLDLNPPYLFVLLFLLSCFVFYKDKKPGYPPEKGFLFLF